MDDDELTVTDAGHAWVERQLAREWRRPRVARRRVRYRPSGDGREGDRLDADQPPAGRLGGGPLRDAPAVPMPAPPPKELSDEAARAKERREVAVLWPHGGERAATYRARESPAVSRGIRRACVPRQTAAGQRQGRPRRPDRPLRGSFKPSRPPGGRPSRLRSFLEHFAGRLVMMRGAVQAAWSTGPRARSGRQRHRAATASVTVTCGSCATARCCSDHPCVRAWPRPRPAHARGRPAPSSVALRTPADRR